MQDEVHRFTISYHRQIRDKGSIASVLENIAGIGEKRRKDLIKAFGSVTKMEEASIEELARVVPEDIAKNLSDYLKARKEGKNKE